MVSCDGCTSAYAGREVNEMMAKIRNGMSREEVNNVKKVVNVLNPDALLTEESIQTTFSIC